MFSSARGGYAFSRVPTSDAPPPRPLSDASFLYDASDDESDSPHALFTRTLSSIGLRHNATRAVVITALLLIAAVLTVIVISNHSQPPPTSTPRPASPHAATDLPRHPSSSRPSPVDLSPAEREVAWILTGDRSAHEKLTARTALALRRAVQGVAITILSLRPALQRDLWLSDCTSYLPCPYPNAAVRAAHPNTDSDSDMFDHLTAQPSHLPQWTLSLLAPPSPEPLFHSAVPAHSHYAPGELAVDQELAMRFQDDLHARQHPADCSKARVLIMDYFHSLGGFGSWSHARALALGLGVRAGRTVIELEGKQGYPQHYSECTKLKGLGGCDMFLAASSCTLPSNWRELVEKDKAEFAKTHSPFHGGSMQQHLDHLKDRQYVMHTEWYLESEAYELYHTNPQGWDRLQLRTELPSHLSAYRVMPECWWSRQLLSYHWRMSRKAGRKLLTLIAQTLKLPNPDSTADYAYAYADALAAAPTHTSHWWLTIQAVKLEWQVEQLAPGLAQALRHEARGAPSELPVLSGDSNVRSRVPLLGYTFIRHGDKGQENALFSEEYYLQLMHTAAREHGLYRWYLGADDLLSPSRVLRLNGGNGSVQLYTSALVDAIEDKEHHPLAAGFVWKDAEAVSDAEREGIVWRTVLEMGVAQLADAFVSTWSSNHPRMVYEMATAVSEARATAPFIGLDMIKEHRKKGFVKGC